MAVDFGLSDQPVDERTHVVAVRGDIDLYSAPEFRQRISEVIDSGKTHIVIDLCDASFIDSTTLGVLVGAIKRLRTRGGSLSIACQDSGILRVFEITGLDQVVAVHETREEALTALR
jgi:anti-sigma B factor antagonist